MWIADIRTADCSDYALPLVSVVWIVLPRDLGNYSEYRCQILRRQLEDFFAVSKCISFHQDPRSESPRDANEPWKLCQFSESLNFPDVRILLPSHREGDHFRCAARCRLNFSTELAAHPTTQWFSIQHRTAKQGGFETMDDMLFAWISTRDTVSCTYDIRCVRDRQKIGCEVVLLHGLDCPSPMQLAMDFLCENGKDADHAALTLCVSCAASSRRYDSDYYPAVICDAAWQLSRLLKTGRSSSINIIVRDVHLLNNFSQFRQCLVRLLAEGNRLLSRANLVYIGGDPFLRVPYVGADGQSAGVAPDEHCPGDWKRVVSILRLQCGDGDDNGSQRPPVEPQWKRLVDDCSLFVATLRDSTHWFGELSSRTKEFHDHFLTESQLQSSTAPIRGFSILFGALQRHYCWQHVLRPLRDRLLFQSSIHGNGVGALLVGSSGSGKTLLVRAAAERLKLRVMQPRPEQLLSGLVGATEKNIRMTFAEAKRLQPCILVFEHFDSLLFDAESGGVLATFLAGLNELREFNELVRLSANGNAVVVGVFVMVLQRSCGAMDDAPRRALHRPDRLSILVDLNDDEASSSDSLVVVKRQRRAELLGATVLTAELPDETPTARSN